ncbi:hypothetical protein Q8F55_005877 [Vanrija albida]|uniref:Resolvase/invertase-type recombinase catalytic domain-containing protein n=1 Tax=Vanrija albida TaxID=181172 RepID=A0ABR3Q3V5_9TREE
MPSPGSPTTRPETPPRRSDPVPEPFDALPLSPAAHPPVKADPVRLVMYGRMSGSTGGPRLTSPQLPSGRSIALVKEAANLALTMIACPAGLAAAAGVYVDSNDGAQLALVKGCIRRILSEFDFLVFIDANRFHYDRPDAEAGHGRPPRTRYSVTQAKAVYIHQWYVDRLAQAAKDRTANPTDYHRHLILLAIHIGHEIVHLLRCQIHYRLAGTVSIPYDTPTNHRDHEFADGGAWERVLFGGRVRGMWATNTPPMSTVPLPDEMVATLSMLNASGFVVVDVADETVATERQVSQRSEQPAERSKTTAFDHLVVKSDHTLEVLDDWCRDIVQRFEQGDFNNMAFPPTTSPGTLPPGQLARLAPWDRRPDIIRSAEDQFLFWTPTIN